MAYGVVIMKHTSVIFGALLALTQHASAGTAVTVIHGQTPDPTYIDLGLPGDSVGDQRIWQFSGKTTDDVNVIMDWIMVTTGQPDLKSGLESRMTSAVFSFANGGSGTDAGDRILVEGIGIYPTKGSTVRMNSTLERAIIGGTGRYANARGTIETTHLEDGTWRHVLNIQ